MVQYTQAKGNCKRTLILLKRTPQYKRSMGWFIMKGFCEKKFMSMLISGTFTKAVMYLMLLSDSIIAGFFIGENGVAGINAITPITAIVTFFGDLGSTGVGIVFSREVGAMRKRRADEIFGQGLIISIGLGLISALMIFVFQNAYFSASGITGETLKQATKYYRFVPINAFLTIVIFYLEQMVFSDGDELCNNICYGFQIGGNIICSIILTKFFGMTGIILGSVIGNSLGILTCLWHFFRKNNTLHFVWHLSFKDFLLTSRYSIVDSSVYICWGLMDYVMIGFISRSYGDSGLIALAVVVSLIEFGVVMDGVGMAMQPLVGTYYGEKNHRLIKRAYKAGHEGGHKSSDHRRRCSDLAYYDLCKAVLRLVRSYRGSFAYFVDNSYQDSLSRICVLQSGFTHHFLLYADRPYRYGDLLCVLSERFVIYPPADTRIPTFRNKRSVGGFCRCSGTDACFCYAFCVSQIRQNRLSVFAG